jgi:hypothetical protein
MGRDLGRHIDVALLRPSDHVDGLGARHVTDVQPRSRQLGNLDISRNDPGLCGGGPAGKAQLPRDLTLVAASAPARKLWILGMLGDNPIESSHIFQRSSHQACIPDAVTIVGEHPYASAAPRHQSELSQLAALQALAHGPHRHDLGMTVARTQRGDVFCSLGSISHRICVRHG